MIEETAHVIELQAPYAWVTTERQDTCGACVARSGCGTAALGKFLGRRLIRMRVLNPIAAEVGESVVIGVREDALLRGSLAVYLLPLLAMMLGALLGSLLAPQLGLGDGLSILAGGAGLAVGFIWLRIFSAKIREDHDYQAVILHRARPNMKLSRI